MLNDSAKKELLSLARRTLQNYFPEMKIVPPDTVSPELNVRQGAFVSLHNGLDLRGCIGQISPDDCLYAVVQHCVIYAASRDTRFAPVTAAEVPALSIEISVLEPLHPIQSIEEIEIGKHGLEIVRGRNRGILLPQVATENEWDVEQFLAQTCRKAGLAASAWREADTRIFTFEAQVFSD